MPNYNYCEGCDKLNILQSGYCNLCQWKRKLWVVPFIVIPIVLILGSIS